MQLDRFQLRRGLALCGLAIALLLATAVARALMTADAQRAPATTSAETAKAGPAAGKELWSADMEERTLRDWYRPSSRADGNEGGGEFNSRSGNSSASAGQSHSGSWSARMALSGAEGGTRLFRWRELRATRETLVSAFFYFPRAYTLTAEGSTGRYLNVFQFKSRSKGGTNDPMWTLDVQNPSPGKMRLALIWWHRTLEGPRSGQSGYRRFRQQVADLPVGRWFELKVQLRQSKDFDGMLRVWQDGELLFDMTQIRTSFANCLVNAWCASNEWGVGNYSDGLSPAPSAIYVDDARIERP